MRECASRAWSLCGLIVLDVLCQFLKTVTSVTPQGDRAPESGSISQIRRCCSEVSVDWISVDWTVQDHLLEIYWYLIVWRHFSDRPLWMTKTALCCNLLSRGTLLRERGSGDDWALCCSFVDKTVANEELSWNVRQCPCEPPRTNWRTVSDGDRGSC